MTDGADEELRQTSSWSRVRRGLRLLVIVWVVLTLAAVVVQMFTADLALRARVGDEQAMASLALASLLHQVSYSLFALALVAASLSLTRAPPDTRAIPLALGAAACFMAVFLLNVIVGISSRTPEAVRVTSADALQTYWVLLALSRALGVVALLATVLRLAAFLGKSRGPYTSAIAIGLAIVDGGVPIHRLLVREPITLAETSPWLYRALVLGLQLAVAFFVVDTALRARQAAEPLALREGSRPKADSKPEADSEPEADSPEPDSEPEPNSQSEPDSEPEPDSQSEPEPEPDSQPDSESEPESEKPQSRTEQLVASVTLALAVALLPVWDAVALGGFASGLRLEAGSVFPSGAVAFALGGVVAGALLARTLPRSPYAARGVFGIALVASLGYLGFTAWETALDRSRRIDSFAVCETMVGLEGEIATPHPEALKHRFEGPHLPNGQPCTSIIEDRVTHRAEHPDGSFRDGMIQISRHFPDDRARFFSIPPLTLLFLVVAGVIVARAARLPRPKS